MSEVTKYRMYNDESYICDNDDDVADELKNICFKVVRYSDYESLQKQLADLQAEKLDTINNMAKVIRENKRYRESLEFYAEFVGYIEEWNKAYPLDIFPKPDLKKARELLESGGMTIDSISAYNMRHVLKRMMEFLDKPGGKQAREVLDNE